MVISYATSARTAEPDQQKIRIFCVWGQSHVTGGGALDGVALSDPQWYHQAGNKVPGCYIWDKIKRTPPQERTLVTVDATRSNEPHAWQEMTPGYSAGDPIEAWITPPVTPSGGWDMLFAHLWREHTGERIFIVKMGPGGSTIQVKPGSPDWNTASLGSGTDSHLDVLLDGYWAPALAAAITMAGGDRDKVTLGGVISMIGSSDIFDAPAMAAYQANLTAIIAHIRGVMAQPGDDLLVPWLIMKSPLPESTIPAPTLRQDVATIRGHQQAVADALTNITVGDAAGMKYGSDDIHLDWTGNAQLGTEMFRKTLGMVGYVGPEGD